MTFATLLQWRHNGCDGVSNHQSRDCLLNRLFRHRSKKTSKLRVTGLCEGNSPVTGEFPAQRASNVENIFWWRHHMLSGFCWILRLYNPAYDWIRATWEPWKMVTSAWWRHQMEKFSALLTICHRSPVNSPLKCQWRGELMFSLICVWISGWEYNREAGELRRSRAHYDVIVMRKPQSGHAITRSTVAR